MNTLRALALTVAVTACTPPETGSTVDVRHQTQVAATRSMPHDFTVLNMQGKPTRIGDVLDGRIAVIDFWATWCKPCKKSLPKVDQLARAQVEGLLVIAINVGEQADKASRFKTELDLSLPIFLDPKAELAPMIGVFSLPRLIVVDRDGSIVHRAKTLDDSAKAKIRALLSTTQ